MIKIFHFSCYYEYFSIPNIYLFDVSVYITYIINRSYTGSVDFIAPLNSNSGSGDYLESPMSDGTIEENFEEMIPQVYNIFKLQIVINQYLKKKLFFLSFFYHMIYIKNSWCIQTCLESKNSIIRMDVCLMLLGK